MALDHPRLFIHSVMRPAIKLNSWLKCFSGPFKRIKGEPGWRSVVPRSLGYVSPALHSQSQPQPLLQLQQRHKPSYFVRPSIGPSIHQSASQSASQSIIRIVFVCAPFSIPINLFGIFGCQFATFFFCVLDFGFLFASLDLSQKNRETGNRKNAPRCLLHFKINVVQRVEHGTLASGLNRSICVPKNVLNLQRIFHSQFGFGLPRKKNGWNIPTNYKLYGCLTFIVGKLFIYAQKNVHTGYWKYIDITSIAACKNIEGSIFQL